ncbi:MAG: succinate dehydrogenase [Chlamydiia bacterium]|nr:succinate dehydrogenase [Chlamydiia bacterium]
MSTTALPLHRAYVWRRLHSLMGLWIVLFLIEHLLTNSQAALLIGANGEGFIRAVNFIKNLPYLPVIEIVLLGVPILMHMAWGFRVLLTSKMNASSSDGTRPAMKQYSRNHAYSWQRITSYLLVIGIIAHVGYMRFYMYPTEVELGKKSAYFVRISMDPGLYTVSDRLGVKLYDQSAIEHYKAFVHHQEAHMQGVVREGEKIQESPPPYHYEENVAALMSRYQTLEDQEAYLQGLQARLIKKDQVIAEASNFGTATLLVVRDSFKSPIKCILYTLFVLAAVYHGFNGLWTFLITWGIVLKMRSQSRAVNWCYGLMVILCLLGLASVWGTYYINLKV